MAVVEEGIRLEENNTLSFGNYERAEKLKVENFEFGGDIYKVRTHNLVTRFSKNGSLVIEAVPGAAIFNFESDPKRTKFRAAGQGQTQFTLELEDDTNYDLSVDGIKIGTVHARFAGKLSFSAELGSTPVEIKLKKK
ncbi:MAG: endosialidase [Eubacterium sp.]|nr:endosialidase [Eubacterium sp.]MCD8239720.1 endosialidase [Clostridiales bacterium]